MNILIVEDSAPMRRMIRSLVQPFIECVFECADGGEAFELYRRHLPDWVLMDIEMKKVDGISATKQIIDAFPAARIVIVTDYDDDDLRETAAAAGACDYVHKENLLDLRRLFAH